MAIEYRVVPENVDCLYKDGLLYKGFKCLYDMERGAYMHVPCLFENTGDARFKNACTCCFQPDLDNALGEECKECKKHCLMGMYHNPDATIHNKSGGYVAHHA